MQHEERFLKPPNSTGSDYQPDKIPLQTHTIFHLKRKFGSEGTTTAFQTELEARKDYFQTLKPNQGTMEFASLDARTAMDQ